MRPRDESAQNEAKKAASDQVLAKGVTIDSGAQFVLSDRITGKLRAATSFTVISDTANPPISGNFANLADGATITIKGTNFQATTKAATGMIWC